MKDANVLRAHYSSTIASFLDADPSRVLGIIALKGGGDTQEQFRSWGAEVDLLHDVLATYRDRGDIHIEFQIPRLGKRIDVLLLIDGIIFILEFKVGQSGSRAAQEQAMDYALDLKHFHSTSLHATICPVVVAETVKTNDIGPLRLREDGVFDVSMVSNHQLHKYIDRVLRIEPVRLDNPENWHEGVYSPTPTIIEAAQSLYATHSILELSRNDAGAKNLAVTTKTVADVIKQSKNESRKSICFVTGVPGAGKTLVGLNLATTFLRSEDPHHSVYLSGNGPLVAVLREALARDSVQRAKRGGKARTKKQALHEVQAFIQNVHHFRDDGIKTAAPPAHPPDEHVAIFDEAQRAWDEVHTRSFMKRKKGIANFTSSEPAFLISCMDRHRDWAVVVCLVGGGQEINRGEAGIKGWLDALSKDFPHWDVYMSPHLVEADYDISDSLASLEDKSVNLVMREDLHLNVSMRSFRTEHVSRLVKEILDISPEQARQTLEEIGDDYPIHLTRDITLAKQWVREQARGSERYGLIVSSYAERLKPYAIDVKSKMNPVHWFLNDRQDVRSSFYLESVATEFHVQGLELDWACVAWDADFRFKDNEWHHRTFKGKAWQNIKNKANQAYQKNAYRVLLTRARLGMVIVVPEGDLTDPTRRPEYYDSTFEYLKSTGIRVLSKRESTH